MQTHAQTEDSTVVFVLFMVGLGKQKGLSKRMLLCVWLLVFRKLKGWEVEFDEYWLDRFDGNAAKAFLPFRGLQKFKRSTVSQLSSKRHVQLRWVMMLLAI